MRSLRQLALLVELSFRSIHQRIGSSLVVIIGVAGVVAVLLSVLGISGTLIRSIEGAGHEERAIVLSGGATTEGASTLSRDAVRMIEAAPGIRRINGKPVVCADAIFVITVRDKETNKRAQLVVRGTCHPAQEFRTEIRIVEGRMPRSGTQELMVGTAASAKYRDLRVGDDALIRGGAWSIVGKFSSDGNARESELLGDAEMLLAAHQRNAYNAVYVRLASSSSFVSFRDAANINPSFPVKVMSERDYYRMQSQPIAEAWHFVAYIASGIMALGATFGAANTMYSIVSSRAREIAVMRAIGFGGVGIVGSVLLEVIALAIIGALIGASVVWMLFSGTAFTTSLGVGSVVAQVTLQPKLVLLGIAWACGIGVLGGLFPAVRAARLPVAVALRDA